MQDIQLSFEFDTPETAQFVSSRYQQIRELKRMAGSAIWETGKRFAAIRDKLSHNKKGGFTNWLNSVNEPRRTAYNCINVFEAFSNSAESALLENIGDYALKILAAPSTPEFAREEAIARAEAGEQITYSKAKDIVDWNKSQVKNLIDEDNEARDKLNSPHLQPTIQSFDTWANDPNPPYEIEEEEELTPPSIELAPTPAPFQQQPMTLLTNSQNDSWRTPARYIEAVHQVLKGIDLDPASTAIANETVKAMGYLTKEDDGLSQPWFGTVFCNPPYGKTNNLSNQGLFAHKLITEYIAGNVIEGIILVNIYSGYGWFAPLRTLPMCLVDHRISFIDPATDEEGDEAKASSVFIYVGKDPKKFYQVFKQFGPCGQFSYDW